MAGCTSLFFLSLISFLSVFPSVRSTKKQPFSEFYGEERVTAQLGDNVTLPCIFHLDSFVGASRLTVHWLKDGVTVYFANKTCCYYPGYQISEVDLEMGNASLELTNVQEKDVGVYTCSIKYENVERSRNTTLSVGEIQEQHPNPRPTAADDVPDKMPQNLILKSGLFSGVVAVTGLLAIFIYCFYEG